MGLNGKIGQTYVPPQNQGYYSWAIPSKNSKTHFLVIFAPQILSLAEHQGYDWVCIDWISYHPQYVFAIQRW